MFMSMCLHGKMSKHHDLQDQENAKAMVYFEGNGFLNDPGTFWSIDDLLIDELLLRRRAIF